MRQGARVCIRGHYAEPKSQPQRLMVTQRHTSHSPFFFGGREMPSEYSKVQCCTCGRSWRSKAKFIADLPNAPEAWWRLSEAQLSEWFDKQAKEKA